MSPNRETPVERSQGPQGAIHDPLSAGIALAGMALMVVWQSPWGLCIGASLTFLGLVGEEAKRGGLWSSWKGKTFEITLMSVFAALAYSVVSGAALNVFGQTTFSDGLFGAVSWLVPFAVVGTQSTALWVFGFLRRWLPSYFGLVVAAAFAGLFFAVLHGWNWPFLIFVAMPIQAVFLVAYVKSRNMWVVFAAGGTYAALVAAMMSVPMPT